MRVYVCVRTSQSVIDPVVLVPQPQDLLLSVLDSVHADGRRLFKVSPALLAAEERPDVPTHHLQHWRRLALQTCVTHKTDTQRQTQENTHRWTSTTGVCVCLPVFSSAVAMASCWTVRTWNRVQREHG